MFIIGFVAAAAYLVNSAEKAVRRPSIIPLEEAKLCNLHTWKKVALITSENVAELQENPDDIGRFETNYCSKCGYIPAKEAMLSDDMLKTANQHIREREIWEQRK